MSRSKLSIRTLRKHNYNGVIHENVILSDYTTFKCGGKCKILMEINTLENFLSVMIYLESIQAEYFIIGAGSNLLVSDNGYEGIIIKLGGDLSRIEEMEDTLMEFGAGVRLAQALAYTCNLGLSGLEDGAGIPATIGGAVYMNAGAYNFEMSKVVEYVVAYVNGKITYFNKTDCKFDYRKSIFQENKGIILRVGLRLEKKEKELISARMKEILAKRNESQPLDFPSAGCVFRRRSDIVVSQKLDEIGLKGLTMGGAKISEKHANFIINYEDASAQDVYELIEIAKKRFFNKTGIMLETEIKFLGEFDEITG